MDAIQKFYSDIEKIKKHARASSSYNGEEVCKEVCTFFEKENKAMPSLAKSFSDYWMQTYILNSADLEKEPSNANIDKLAAMQSLLNSSDENTECLTDSDWKELCSLVNYEAEDLPLENLSFMMSLFLEKQALK